jgi:hypothetical protein
LEPLKGHKLLQYNEWKEKWMKRKIKDYSDS